MVKKLLLILACCTAAACAAARPSYVSEPASATFSNELYDVSLKPQSLGNRPDLGRHVKSFRLTIVNKTDRPIELLWDKTSYLQDGSPRGGFTFHGIPYKDKDMSKPPQEIAPLSTFSRSVYPSILIHYTGPYSGWELGDMEPGRHGAMLALRIGERETRVKLSVTLKES